MKKVKVGKSKIHGKGLFTQEPIKKGELILPVHSGIPIDNDRIRFVPNQFGKFYNHDEKNFNTSNEVIGDKRYLRALKNIPAGSELTANYREHSEMEQPEDFGKGKYASFDFDKTIATPEGLAKAKKMFRDGYNLFIVSARDKVTPDMIARARQAGIPVENIIATGSDEAKVRKVKQLGVEKHFDDKPEVIAALGSVGEQFRKGGSLNSMKYTKSIFGKNKLFVKNKLFKPKKVKNRIYDPNAKYYEDGGLVDYDRGGSNKPCGKGQVWNPYTKRCENALVDYTPLYLLQDEKRRILENNSDEEFKKYLDKTIPKRSYNPTYIQNLKEVTIKASKKAKAAAKKANKKTDTFSSYYQKLVEQYEKLKNSPLLANQETAAGLLREIKEIELYDPGSTQEILYRGNSFEDKINSALDNPMDKAAMSAYGAAKEDNDPIDNFRHPQGGRYAAEAIMDYFPDWAQYTGIPQAAGFLGANAMGVGHELETIFNDDRPWLVKFTESGEDILNNAVGAGVGILPMSSRDKTNALLEFSNQNMLPDGIVDKNPANNVYLKKGPNDPGQFMSPYKQELGGSLNTFSRGGEQDCPPGQYWNGKKCTRLITLKNDRKYIDGVANWAMHVDNNDVRKGITSEYNDQIKNRLYSGKYGFDPESGALIRLDKIQPQSVTTLDAKTKASREKEKLKEQHHYAEEENKKAYEQSITDAGFDPATFGKAKGVNTITGEPIYASSKEEAERKNQEAINQAAIEGHAAVVNNPVFKAGAYMTPVGMAIGAMEGLARFIPDATTLAQDPTLANAGQLGLDALQVLPFAKPITNTVKSALKNTYKINPWALKENPEMFLYRAEPTNFDTRNTVKTLQEKLANNEGTAVQQARWKNYINEYNQGHPKLVAQNDFHGQWLEKDPARLDWYLYSGDKVDVGTPMSIFRTKIPTSQAAQYNVGNIKKANVVSASPETEFVMPRNIIEQGEKFPESSWQQLIQEDKAFNTPHWLKGYGKVPKELPGSPNASISDRLKQFFDRPPGPLMLLGPSGSGSNMVKKNLNYYKQLLDSYDSKKMSFANRKFYNDLIETGRKQGDMLTEAQLRELDRLKNSNFDFGKRGYNKESLLQVEPKAPIEGGTPPPVKSGYSINLKGAFQRYPKGPLTEEEILAYKNSPEYQKFSQEHADLINKYGSDWTLPNYMDEHLNEAITTGNRSRVNPILYGGRNWNATDYTIAGLVASAYPGAAAVFGTAFSPPPIKNKILKNVGVTGVPGGLSSKDTLIDITNTPMDFAKVNETKDGKIIIGGEFIEDANNTVRKAKDWLTATDTYSDKKYPSNKIESFYGIEDGKFKVGKANEFDPDTEIVPRRFGAKNIDKAIMNGNEMRLLDKNGDPIYQNTPNTGKFILYSPSTKKAEFAYITSGKKGVDLVNDFLKKNKDAQYIHLDNGRYEYYGLNPGGLTKQDFESYYHQDLGREGTPGYNLIIKEEGGETDYQLGDEVDEDTKGYLESLGLGYTFEEI